MSKSVHSHLIGKAHIHRVSDSLDETQKPNHAKSAFFQEDLPHNGKFSFAHVLELVLMYFATLSHDGVFFLLLGNTHQPLEIISSLTHQNSCLSSSCFLPFSYLLYVNPMD